MKNSSNKNPSKRRATSAQRRRTPPPSAAVPQIHEHPFALVPQLAATLLDYVGGCFKRAAHAAYGLLDACDEEATRRSIVCLLPALFAPRDMVQFKEAVHRINFDKT